MSVLTSFWQRIDFFELFIKQLPRFYRRQDAILHSIVALLFFASLLMGTLNAQFFHFTVMDFPTVFLTAVPGLIVVWCVGVLIHAHYQRWGLFLTSFSQSFLFLVLMCYVICWTITTPFPPIDRYLLHFDDFFQFSTLGLMTWTYQQHWLIHILNFCYDTWFFQLLLTPLALALFNDRVETDRYFIATFVALFIGIAIYYFLPTIAPAGVLQSQYFSPDQHALVTRFYEVHRFLPVSTYDGGFIAFPSFHVINCLLVMYAWRRYAWVFLPLLVVNIFSIFSTMALGYHYLADVLAAFVIAYASVKLADYLLKRFS
ncbi:MAG: hypothetical protein A3F10_00160 [Coxiella sp. RIFCSPHIGHO2_12_FULL_42_15]|nr:MAG: hypothetical protein A3F10_00160 [Coxiella sp. RIFCSPHIGHO2_12_FULL_42_15]